MSMHYQGLNAVIMHNQGLSVCLALWFLITDLDWHENSISRQMSFGTKIID